MQLGEEKTYRTRDGSRTGIRVKRTNDTEYPWRGTDRFGYRYRNDGGWDDTGACKRSPFDLIEEEPATPAFSFTACPLIGDGPRRRAVTRDGRDVVLLCDDGPGDRSLVGWIVGRPLRNWKADGRNSLSMEFDGTPTDLLIPPPPKRVVWVNVYPINLIVSGRTTFLTQEEADHAATCGLRLGNRAYPIEIDGDAA